MTFESLLEVVNAVYPDDQVIRHWNARSRRPFAASQGDTLALFVVSELHATFDASASDEVQLRTAVEKIERAILELDGVKMGLMREYLRRRETDSTTP